jgi:hypothetical protein
MEVNNTRCKEVKPDPMELHITFTLTKFIVVFVVPTKYLQKAKLKQAEGTFCA